MVCVTGAGADVDSAWEQKKLEATHSEMLALGAARRPLRSTLIRYGRPRAQRANRVSWNRSSLGSFAKDA